MIESSRKYDLDRIFRIIIAVLGVIGLYALLAYLSDVLIPFGIAFVLAYLLNPIATYFQKKTKHRLVAVGITLTLFLGTGALIIGLVVPRMADEFAGMSQFVSEFAQKGPAFWQNARSKLPPEVLNVLHDFLRSDSVQELATKAAGKIAPGVWDVLTGALSVIVALMSLIIVLMYLAFLLLDFQRVESSWKDYLPPKHKDSIVEFLTDFNHALSKYFRGQAIVALIVGVLFAIGFSIVGIRLAIVLGLLIGLLNMVPYLQTVAIVPAFLLGLFRFIETGSGFWWYMIGVALVFVIVQLLQDAILVPKIMGDVTGLRPAVVMLSIFIWGKLLGFIGLLLAIPLTVLALTYYQRMIARQRLSRTSTDPNNTQLSASKSTSNAS